MQAEQYQVIRDTRERDEKGWWFPEKDRCLGTVEEMLPTGDYSLKGFEKVFVIERKGCISEFAKNLVQDRFHDELYRLDKFEHPFLVLEFEMSDVVNWPKTSGIPPAKQRFMRMTPQFVMQRVCELQLEHRARIIFAGKFGRHFASSLFKRIIENVTVPT